LHIYNSYLIACLTFSFSKNIDSTLVKYFVGFILIYPLIVLGVFFRLVTKHHTKLYAPEDFIIPEHFIQCIYGNQESEINVLQKSAAISSESILINGGNF
jgi:hypothetical protein